MNLFEQTEADREELDQIVCEMRLSSEEALANDPAFEAWLEKVAASLDEH